MTRVLCDRYELGSLVGAGGTARVYEARDHLLGRRVAVKLLDSASTASNDPGGRERFLAEARSSASFSHRGVVAAYDAGEADGDLFIVMEFVEGTSLAQEIATRAPMPEAEAVRISTELLAALGAAHEVGVVHRDVKPANILIRHDGAVKLADFGIAKRFGDMASALTMVGTVVGTPRYLAPEQAAGQPSTPAVDIYAVGIVLHEMLTGVAPSANSDVRTLRADVSPGVAAAISRALSADPQDRFASGAEMASALSAATVASAAQLATTATMAAMATAGAGSTQVMEQVGAPTQLRSAPGAPVLPVLTPRSTPTAVVRTHPTPGRVVDIRIPEPPRRRRDRAPLWWAASVVVLTLVAVSMLALAQRDSTAPELAAATTAAPASPTTIEPVAADTVAFLPVDPQDPTSVLPVAPLSEPTEPEPAAPPQPAELIPGFAATDDILVFIAQLRDGKDVVGKQSKKLGDRLHKLLEEDAEDRPDEARKLAEDVREWVEDGELDPTVASAALEFIAPLR